MKIGIVSSGNETLALWKILTKYNHEYLVYHDQSFFPFGSKDFSFIGEEIQKAVLFLRSHWAEKILLDPVYELALASNDILPLFQTYLSDYAFKYSLVGKIWILTDFGSKEIVQELVENTTQQHTQQLVENTTQQHTQQGVATPCIQDILCLTEHQKNTKKFSFPFSYRVKSASARTAWISDLGVHNPYLIRTLKNDLKYFKDANVDTLLPMHYHYFHMQRTIKAFFNFGKTRFHDLSVVEECFKKLTTDSESSAYSVHLRTNQDPKFLFKEKELVRLLQRGKGVELKVERI